MHVYSEIAKHFDETRHTPWPSVVDFIKSKKANRSSRIALDIGCGNGKYLSALTESASAVFACDTCPELLECAKQKIASSHSVEFTLASGTNLPYAGAMFDMVICVAVLHHLETPAERQTFMNEIYRVLKPGAQALVTVWNTEAAKPDKWRNIRGNDYAVPWHDKYSNIVHDRFYHLFTGQEMFEMAKASNFRVIKLANERGNWYAVLQKSL